MGAFEDYVGETQTAPKAQPARQLPDVFGQFVSSPAPAPGAFEQHTGSGVFEQYAGSAQPMVPGQMTMEQYQQMREQSPGFLPSVWEGVKQIPGMLKEDVGRAAEEVSGEAGTFNPIKTGLAGMASAAYDLGMLARMAIDPLTAKVAKMTLPEQARDYVDLYFANEMQKAGQLREDVRTGRTSLLDVRKTAAEQGVAPGLAEVGSYVLDPSLLAGGGAKLASKLTTTAAKAPRMLAIPTLERAGQAAGRFAPSQLAGSATRAAERGAGRALEVTGRVTRELAEKPVGKAIQHVAPVAGYMMGGPVGAALGFLSKYIVVGKRGGGLAENAGRALQAWGESLPGKSTLSRLQQLSVSEKAPRLVRNVASKLAAFDPAFKFAGDVRRAAGAGADIVAPAVAAKAASGDTGEAGQLLGTGWTMGSMGHIMTAPFTHGMARRMMEEVDAAAWYAGKSQSEQAALAIAAGRHGDKVLKTGMMLDAFLNTLKPEGGQPGVAIEWLDNATWAAATGMRPGVAGSVHISTETGRPVVRINAETMHNTTIGHEVFHAMGKDPRIVNMPELNGVLFDQVAPDGTVISKGLFSKAEMDALAGRYLSQFDVTSQAFKDMVQERQTNPSKFNGRISEEIAAELFGAWIGKQDGRLLSSLPSLSRRMLDAAIMSKGRNWFSKGVSRMVDAFGLRQTAEGIQSEVFPGLTLTPEIDVMFRRMMRNRMNMGGHTTEAGVESPRVGAEKTDFGAETATFDAREAMSGAEGARLAQIFSDNDIWQRNPDGSIFYDNHGRPALRSPGEMRRLEKQRQQALFAALRSVDSAGGLEDRGNRFEGVRMNAEQLDAVAKLDPRIMPPSLVQKLRTINGAIETGQALDMNYNPALMKNKYSTRLGMAYRVGVPLRMDVTKAGNLLIITYDKVHLMDKLARWWDADLRARDKGKSAKYLAPWDDYGQLLNDLNVYIDNVRLGRPGDTGIGLDKKNRLNDLFNFRTLDTEGANPMRLSSGRGERDTVIRSRRFDRINSVTPVEGTAENVNYWRILQNLQPGTDLPVSAGKATPEPSQARTSLSEDTGVAPKPPGAAPGTFPFDEAAGRRGTGGMPRGFTDSEKFGIPDEWKEPGQQMMQFQPGVARPEQKITSAKTSIKQVPAKKFFEGVEFAEGTRNADIGAGKYMEFSDFLAERGVENLRYDPFNLSPEENAAFAKSVQAAKADTATINNVLNVIKEAPARDFVIAQAAATIKPDGTAYFKVYYDPKGKKGETAAGFQNQMKPEAYVSEIKKHFADVTRKGEMIIARDPIDPKVIGKDIMFSPGTTERVTHAALRIPDEEGNLRTYTSSAHFLAIMKASRDMGIETSKLAELEGVQDGFVTDAGRFVTRQKAYELVHGEGKEGMLDSSEIVRSPDETPETFMDVLEGNADPFKVEPSPEMARRGIVPSKDGVRSYPQGSKTYQALDTMFSPGNQKEIAKAFDKFAKPLTAEEKQRVKDIAEMQTKFIEELGPGQELDGLLMLEDTGGSGVRPNAAPQYVRSIDFVTSCVRDLSLQGLTKSITKQAVELGIPVDGAVLASLSLLRGRGVLATCLECYKLNAQIPSADKFARTAADWDKLSVDRGNNLERSLAAFRDAGFKKSWFDPLWKLTPVDQMKIPAEFLDKKVQRYDDNGPLEGKFHTIKSFMAGKMGPGRQTEGYAPMRAELLSDGKVRVAEIGGERTITMGEFIDWVKDFGGFRFLSNSDFQPEHAIDHYQALGQLDARNGTAHAYTNLPDLPIIFSPTGLKVNMSVYMDVLPNGQIVNRKGQGMPLEKALEIQRKYPNAGIVLIAHNEAVLKWAMEHPEIRYILPSHLNARQNKIMSPLKWRDFGYGMEHFRDPNVDVDKLPKDLQKHIYRDAKGKPHIRIKMSSHTNLSKGDNIKSMWKRYKRLCDRLGCTYRFENTPEIFGEVKGDAKAHTPPEGYMKVVVDFARWDTPQTPIRVRRTDHKKLAEVIRMKIEDGQRTGHDGERLLEADDMMAVVEFLKANKGKGATGIIAEAEKFRMGQLQKDLK